MQPLFEHRLELAGISTRALELEGDGPPFVLLHGFADSADTWRLTLAELGRADRAAIAVDLPGFGTAPPLDAEGAVLPQLDHFVDALVRHVAREHGSDVVVVGNSLGGCLALRAAERRRLPIAAVVPVAPAGLDMARWFAMVERDPLLRTVLLAPLPVPEALLRAVVGQLYRTLAFARPLGVAGDVVHAFTDHHRHRDTVARYLATARRMLPELRDPFRLDRVSTPVLLVWGDRDRLVSHSGAERVTAAVPGARFVLIEGCGHCPQIEASAPFVEALLSFATRRRRRRVA
jgi:pimeloyl-ACP methyl ester carboxylesterase